MVQCYISIKLQDISDVSRCSVP